MGGGDYKGGASYYHSITDNLKEVSSIYKYNNGYFGESPKENAKRIRHIESDDPSTTAKDFYDKIAYGGIESDIPKGKIVEMEDGTVITWRNVSSSDGSPAVDINIERSRDSGGLKKQKIHFVKGGK